MLETLDDVAWGELQHAYGAATDVPNLLRALASGDREQFERALNALYGNIYHQGDRYSASSRAIPFLFELALSSEQLGRSNVLSLITALVAGDCGFRNGQTLNDGERALFFGRELSAQEAEGEAPRIWLECYRATLPFVETLLELVEHGDDAIGLPANYVLSCFRPLASSIAPRLLARLRVEPFDDRKVAQLFALHRLHGPAFDAVASLTQLLSELSGVTHTMAAMCVANLTREHTRDAIAGYLKEGLIDINQNPRLEDFYSTLPFAEGFAGDLAHVVARMNHAQAKRLLAPLARTLGSEVGMLPSIGLTAGTLRAGFAAPYQANAQLKAIERTALAALIGNEQVWRVGNNAHAFSAYGLPSSRQQVSKLAKIEPGDIARGKAAFDTALPLCREGRIAEALPDLELALELWPQEQTTWFNLAWALRQLERFEEAAVLAERGLSVFEDAWQLASQRAGALIALKRYAECEAAAAQGLLYAPDDGYLLYTQACANALLGRSSEALAGVRRTIEVDPDARQEIAADPDFDSLRSMPEFQALITP